MTRRRLARFAVIFCTVLGVSACQSAAERDAVRLAGDHATAVELNRINTLLASNWPVTRIDIDSLNGLRDRYPNSAAIRQLLQGALIKRQDWAAAEKLIVETPESERTSVVRLNLAKIYLKQGKFGAAVDQLKMLPKEESESVEAKALLGQAQFYLGELDAAARTFESILQPVLNEKRTDELALLGTIYLRRGEHEKAINTLQRAVGDSPDNISANNALSRAYAAAGDLQRSETYSDRVKEISDKIAAAEKKKSRLVPLYYQLEDAYAARNFDKVISLVEEIRPEADNVMKATLYQYLASAYQAQGKESEAKNALAEAAKLTPK